MPTFNGCLKIGHFFESWKAGLLVLIQNGTKPLLDQPSSYRLLCQINFIEKLFEKLLKVRIQEHVSQQPDLIILEQQFRFMKSKSTTQAIQLVMSIVERADTGQSYIL